jgi:hypothetical protein
MIFFMVMPALIGGYNNFSLPLCLRGCRLNIPYVLTILAIYCPYTLISFQVAYVVLSVFILLPHLISQVDFSPILFNFFYNSSVDHGTDIVYSLPFDPVRDPDNFHGGSNNGGIITPVGGNYPGGDNNPGGGNTGGNNPGGGNTGGNNTQPLFHSDTSETRALDRQIYGKLCRQCVRDDA